jgi:hypothetical protein
MSDFGTPPPNLQDTYDFIPPDDDAPVAPVEETAEAAPEEMATEEFDTQEEAAPEEAPTPDPSEAYRRENMELRERLARLEGRLESRPEPKPQEAAPAAPKYNFPPALKAAELEEIANSQGPGAMIDAYSRRNVVPVILQMHDRIVAAERANQEIKAQLAETSGYTTQSQFTTNMSQVLDNAESSFLGDIASLPDADRNELHQQFISEVTKIVQDPEQRARYFPVDRNNPAHVKNLSKLINLDGVKARVLASAVGRARTAAAPGQGRVIGDAKKEAVRTIGAGSGRIPKTSTGNQPTARQREQAAIADFLRP